MIRPVPPVAALLPAAAAALLLLAAACADEGSTPPSVSATPAGSAGPADSTGSPSATSALTPTPARSWAGEPAGVLVFVDFRNGRQDIFSRRLPDGDDVALTDDPLDDFDPDISEDGSKIAFVSNRSGQAQVYVMDAGGGNVRQLTSDGLGGQTPRWSRDGSRIAFSRGGSVAVMNSDGSDVRTIMEAEPEATADPCRAGAFVGGWSPDDSQITYYSASLTRSIGQVCLIDSEGGPAEPEVVAAEDGAYLVEPVISPDGSQIVYRAIIGGQHDIWVIDLESGERRNLTSDADLDIEPDWSPDGQWIAFGSLRQGEPNFDLYIMRPDGSDVRRITSEPTKEANPVWGPG